MKIINSYLFLISEININIYEHTYGVLGFWGEWLFWGGGVQRQHHWLSTTVQLGGQHSTPLKTPKNEFDVGLTP